MDISRGLKLLAVAMEQSEAKALGDSTLATGGETPG